MHLELRRGAQPLRRLVAVEAAQHQRFEPARVAAVVQALAELGTQRRASTNAWCHHGATERMRTPF